MKFTVAMHSIFDQKFLLVMYIIRVRAIVGIMIFFGYFLTYVVRYNLSVHIVDMAQILKRDDDIMSPDNDSDLTLARAGFNARQGSIVNLINWDDLKVGRLFSAYHIGYCICFPIFHNIGDRLGPTWIVGIAGITSGVLNCLTPAAAYHHFWLLFIVRIIKGFCAGAMQPSMVQLLRHWVPPMERNHFMWAYCGITTGTFSTFLICAAVQYCCRWVVGFYVTGGLQILWAATWILVITDYPGRHPCIPSEELVYLNNTIGTIFTIKKTNSQAPWRLILRSGPFWALCILNYGYAWLIISLCLHGPLYYSRIAEYSIYTASTLTALPFCLRLVLGTIVIQTFHWYKHNAKLKRIKYIRKYFIVFSHVLPGLMVASCWVTQVIPGPILLSTAVAMTAFGMDLALDLCYELSPTFVNSINTVMKIVGNISGIIVSLSVGQVTYEYKNSSHVWKHIWCFHATMLWLSGVIFLIWGDTHVQPWNSVSVRPQHLRRPIIPKPSIMSNIMEVDEDDNAIRPTTVHYLRNSILSKGPFRIQQSRVNI